MNNLHTMCLLAAALVDATAVGPIQHHSPNKAQQKFSHHLLPHTHNADLLPVSINARHTAYTQARWFEWIKEPRCCCRVQSREAPAPYAAAVFDSINDPIEFEMRAHSEHDAAIRIRSRYYWAALFALPPLQAAAMSVKACVYVIRPSNYAEDCHLLTRRPNAAAAQKADHEKTDSTLSSSWTNRSSRQLIELWWFAKDAYQHVLKSRCNKTKRERDINLIKTVFYLHN